MSLDIRYVAGLMDGEGCIAIRRRDDRPKPRNQRVSYALVVQISMTHERVIHELHQSMGGAMSEIKWHRRMNNRPAYQWRLYSNACAEFLEKCLPYLIVKREETLLAISFQKHLNEYKKKVRRMPNEMVDQIWAYRESVYWTMRNLKKVSGALDGMDANSGDTQCPVSNDAEGQSRAKQTSLALVGRV